NTYFGSILNAADFTSASSGPPAQIIQNNPSWISSISSNPLAKWINNTGSNISGSTCLYAIDFTINQPIDSADFQFSYCVDNTLGGNGNQGIYLNGQALSGTTTGGTFTGVSSIYRNNIAPLLQQGLNTLYINSSDLGGAGGLIFSATIRQFCTSQYWYADADGDGYGNPLIVQNSCTQPIGFVSNDTDCNDADSLEHPNQIWYSDADNDGYGTGNFIIQCTRPANRFATSELLAISGDCDDNNPSIYPNYQEFEFSGIGNFTSSTIYPSEGDSYTTFNFEVIYKDASGAFPTPTFPRVILDYEGNSIYNNTNDRTIIMIEDDLSDSNTVDGKKYIASINGLPTGTNWKTFIQTNNFGCGSNFGPFNYPDVLTRPDLEIFANDITFSVPHPSISSPLSISAEVHNVSDYPAQNIVVHLTDQYDLNTVYTDITIPNLSPHSSTIVTWNLTTIATPSWHPMEVKVDYTNTINESNELDNVAIRPYINGNYNLPGSILTTAYASPSVSYIGSSNYITLSGRSFYSGTAVPLNDSSVSGATISFTIVETGASFTTYTNSNGNFAYSFPKPLVAGIYHIVGTCTDYTLTGNLSTQFELIVPIISICELPNLVANIVVSSNDIVQGNSISGNLIVKNLGMTTSTPTLLSIAQSGGTPIISTTYNIPSLAQFQSDTIPFTLTFNNIGQFSICAYADASYLENECSENNSHCEIINVLPPLPDILPTSGPEGFKYECEINNISFDLHNYGGVNTGPFNCKIEIKQNGLLIETINHAVANILPIQYSPSNKVSFSIPFNPPTIGNYTFEIFADYPINEVVELNELNNHATYTLTAIACKPDFKFYTCENFNVESPDGNYTEGTNITLKANIVNSGNLTFSGNLTIRFSLSSGLNYDTTLFVNLSPTSSFNISKLIAAPLSATTTLTVIVDPFHLIDELNEANNSISNNMCWEFKPVPYCVPNVLGNYLVNQTAILSIAVGSYALYDADTLKVKFEVSGPGVSGTLNLGNGTMYNLKQSCLCPLGVTLPTTFTFPQTGTYIFTMTVDPDNDFIECDETNNVLAFTVNVTNLPDLRILSHLISPSKLNPEPNENINMNITYENIGASNINDLMKLKVIVDNTPIDSIYPVGGLIHNGNNTISIPTSWSSPLVGVHVIRAIIDDDNQVAETNELNNEATRAVVVGESANLYFQVLASNTLSPILNNSMSINSRIGNNGDLNCQADLQLLYVNDNLDTIQIALVPIQIDAHDSQSYFINWIVPDNQTTIIGRILNSSILEYTYDDNEASFKIGEMRIVSRSSPACLSSNTIGSAEAYVIGGIPPYNYIWNNGFNGSILNASPGNYTIVVSDNTGQTATSTVTITECPGIIMNLKYLIEGYHTSNEAMTDVLINEGQYNFPTDVDTVLIELHHDTIGYPMLSSFKGVLQTNGMMSCYFDSTNLIGTSCYIVVKHRNAIETWSANPISISNGINGILNYDFTSAANKAFGSNQSEVESGVWALFSGDLNDDDNIDLLDLSNLESDINTFQFGYFASDINGDGNVDLLDIPIVESNINYFIFSNHP
ncbi:MAG TPA: CARDB domain-containing protein, partial [Chitinophagaceae bacterium]|nr:CARDB domain-containing protein [Chitinophagaceae bacterium]